MSKNFVKKLQNFIFRDKILQQRDKILIGISGGPDSIALALVLKKIEKKYDLELFLVHINYHQRGEDSEKDQKFVEEFAGKNDFKLEVVDFPAPFGVGQVSEPEVTETKGKSEEIMRDFRYQKFEEIRKKIKFDKIAVAHTQDDQVETFWLNLLRGSGIQGLVGMKSVNNLIVRPFLIFTKKEIESFLKENDQEFRIDKTNLEVDFTRNKIRLELIPYLEENFETKIKEKIGKLISNLQNEKEVIDFWLEKDFNNFIKKKEQEFIWNISKAKDLPEGCQRVIFRKIILELKGDLKNVSMNNFEEFKKIVESEKSKNQTMKIGKIVLIKNKNCVIFKKVI
jgi:tRNA(Ile)-lysidine synthase